MGKHFGPMGVLVAVILGMVGFVIVYSFIPAIGTTVVASAPVGDAVYMGAGKGYNFSVWNMTAPGQTMTNASTLWASWSGMPLAAIIAIVAMAVLGGFLFLGRR